MGHSKSSPKRKFITMQTYLKETKKISNSLTLHGRKVEKEPQTAQSEYKKDIIKIIGEIKQYKKSEKRKTGSLKR